MKDTVYTVLLSFIFCLNYQIVQGRFNLGRNPKNMKTFYADNTQRTLADAKSYCAGLNPAMSLAQIDDMPGDGDYDFLDGKWSQNFTGWYWTSGRDSRTYSQFVWEDPSGVVPVSGFGSLEFVGNGSCLTFYSKREAGASHALAMPCDTRSGSTLCQHF